MSDDESYPDLDEETFMTPEVRAQHREYVRVTLVEAGIPLADWKPAFPPDVVRDLKQRIAELEAALVQIIPDVRILLDDHFSGCREEALAAQPAAARLITLLQDDDENDLPVAGLVIPGPTLAERHEANRA